MLTIYCPNCGKNVVPDRIHDEIIDEDDLSCPDCGNSLNIDNFELQETDDFMKDIFPEPVDEYDIDLDGDNNI